MIFLFVGKSQITHILIQKETLCTLKHKLRSHDCANLHTTVFNKYTYKQVSKSIWTAYIKHKHTKLILITSTTCLYGFSGEQSPLVPLHKLQNKVYFNSKQQIKLNLISVVSEF